ncbi:MAG TPA: hypothetical protein VM866_04820 [Pyrinomonadaceae bacterium]|nr:hypothetical protein [Pyrinomonadaceae bacterium]
MNPTKLIIAALLLTLAATPALAQARRRKTAPAAKVMSQPTQAEAARAVRTKARNDLVKATDEYKASLARLLELREASAKKAAAQTEKLRELYKEGIISKQEIEKSEGEIIEARAAVEDVRAKIGAADTLLAEAMIEDEVAPTSLAKLPSAAAGSFVRKTAYIRFNGLGNWSLSNAGQVSSFFASKFGRVLPISAFGQSELHNRWGFSHHNAMDVAVHPDSREGQALISYLQGAGIPFIAFRQAVPGSASGPHIHIGRPSSRTR